MNATTARMAGAIQSRRQPAGTPRVATRHAKRSEIHTWRCEVRAELAAMGVRVR